MLRSHCATRARQASGRSHTNICPVPATAVSVACGNRRAISAMASVAQLRSGSVGSPLTRCTGDCDPGQIPPCVRVARGAIDPGSRPGGGQHKVKPPPGLGRKVARQCAQHRRIEFGERPSPVEAGEKPVRSRPVRPPPLGRRDDLLLSRQHGFERRRIGRREDRRLEQHDIVPRRRPALGRQAQSGRGIKRMANESSEGAPAARVNTARLISARSSAKPSTLKRSSTGPSGHMAPPWPRLSKAKTVASAVRDLSQGARSRRPCHWHGRTAAPVPRAARPAGRPASGHHRQPRPRRPRRHPAAKERATKRAQEPSTEPACVGGHTYCILNHLRRRESRMKKA